LTQDNVQFTEEEKRLREEIEKKHGKTPEELYEEREKRVRDAIALTGLSAFRPFSRLLRGSSEFSGLL